MVLWVIVGVGLSYLLSHQWDFRPYRRPFEGVRGFREILPRVRSALFLTLVARSFLTSLLLLGARAAFLRKYPSLPPGWLDAFVAVAIVPLISFSTTQLSKRIKHGILQQDLDRWWIQAWLAINRAMWYKVICEMEIYRAERQNEIWHTEGNRQAIAAVYRRHAIPVLRYMEVHSRHFNKWHNRGELISYLKSADPESNTSIMEILTYYRGLDWLEREIALQAPEAPAGKPPPDRARRSEG